MVSFLLLVEPRKFLQVWTRNAVLQDMPTIALHGNPIQP